MYMGCGCGCGGQCPQMLGRADRGLFLGGLSGSGAEAGAAIGGAVYGPIGAAAGGLIGGALDDGGSSGGAGSSGAQQPGASPYPTSSGTQVSPAIQTQISPQISPAFQQSYMPQNSPMTAGATQSITAPQAAAPSQSIPQAGTPGGFPMSPLPSAGGYDPTGILPASYLDPSSSSVQKTEEKADYTPYIIAGAAATGLVIAAAIFRGRKKRV